MTRQVFLDVETTGLSPLHGDRVIEIGCIEALGCQSIGRTFHRYCNPERSVSAKALAVHGLENLFLRDQPLFSTIVHELLAFVRGAEVIIHNARFDVGFLNAELKRVQRGCLSDYVSSVTDSLLVARRLFPGQPNSLDALCMRLGVLRAGRQQHGALQDARLLAKVYAELKARNSTL